MMLKRRYGNRPGWKRIIDKDYAQSYMETVEFKGYVSLLKINNVTEPLNVQYKDKKVCIVDDGYIWLQHFPTDVHHSLTTMFNSKGEVVQWYVDICYRNGIENDVPFMEDLYLDIVVLPDGEIIQLDGDELEEALIKGKISESLYKMAWAENERLFDLIKRGAFQLLELAEIHKDQLLRNIRRF